MLRITNLIHNDVIYSGSVSQAEYVGTFEILRTVITKVQYVDEKSHVNPV